MKIINDPNIRVILSFHLCPPFFTGETLVLPSPKKGQHMCKFLTCSFQKNVIRNAHCHTARVIQTQ